MEKSSKIMSDLMCVSRNSFASCVLPSLTSTAGQTSRILLAYVILWINKASLVLHVYKALTVSCHNRSEVWKLYCTIEFISLWSGIETIEVSQLHLCDWGARLCTHYNTDNLLLHAPLQLELSRAHYPCMPLYLHPHLHSVHNSTIGRLLYRHTLATYMYML